MSDKEVKKAVPVKKVKATAKKVLFVGKNKIERDKEFTCTLAEYEHFKNNGAV